MRTSIPDADVLAFIKSLGVDPKDVSEVVISPGAVKVTEFRRDKDGHFFVIGHNPALVTTDIRIERGA